MKAIRVLAALLALSLAPSLAHAQRVEAQTVSSCGTPNNTPVVGLNYPLTQDPTGKLCTGALGTISGSTSNATSGQATTSNNLPTVTYNYGFNGTTWDQLQVDASKFLKVNCTAGCSGGSASNASDAVATSSTNGTQNAWLFAFNGTTFDRLRDDTNKFLSVNLGDVGGSAFAMASNASSAVATSATNLPAIAFNFGFNGTTWDQLQVDGSKNLKVNCTTGCAAPAAATHSQCAALCANQVVKASAGTLYSFEVSADSTLSAAAWYVMIYDATSAPADGAVTPAKCFQQASGQSQMGGTYTSGGVSMTTGITIGVSSTGCFTKTASTHAFISADFQ